MKQMKERLICTKDLIMDPAAIMGKTYKVVRENNSTVTIKNEYHEEHSFFKDPNSPAYFGLWFSFENEEEDEPNE